MEERRFANTRRQFLKSFSSVAAVGAGLKASRGVFPSDFLKAIEDHPLAFIKSRT